MIDEHRSVEAIQASEGRLRQIIDGVGPSILVGLLTPEGVLLEINRAGLEATGLTPGQALGKRLDDLPPWTHSASLRQQLREAIDKAAKGEASRYDARVRGAGGQLIDVDFSLQPVRDESGKVTCLVPSATIITDRKRAEEHVQKLNRIYGVLSRTTQSLLRQRDISMMLRSACDIAFRRGGFSMAWIGLLEGSSTPLRVAAHAGASKDTVALINALLQGNPTMDCAITAFAIRTGQQGVCNDIATDPRAATWRDEALRRGYRSMASLPLVIDSAVRGTFNLYHHETGFFSDEELCLLDDLALDISFALEMLETQARQRNAESALSLVESRFRELAENIQEVFWIRDSHRPRVLYASPAFEKIWGRRCADLYQLPSLWLDSVHAEDRERVEIAWRARHAGIPSTEVYRITTSEGAVRWIRDRGFPVRAPDGQLIHIVGTAEDITQQRLLEEQLRQAQKLEAVGQLAGGIAHDFNNVLTIIQGFGSLLMAENLAGDAAVAAREIVNAAERAANLTRQMLAIGRRQLMKPQALDLNGVIRSIEAMLQRVLSANTQLELRFHEGLLMTRADAGMLDQVLMNLTLNARDAMPNGGTLRIETFRCRVDEPPRDLPSLPTGSYVGLRVSDTGVGISPEHLQHIFEPFFTTKEPGKGTGLGLPTVYGIVTQHRGTVQVRSVVGEGTTMEVWLPALHESAAASKPAAQSCESAASDPGGSETVLVVEDDPHVRALTRTILERKGYRVLAAGSGPEALEVWAEQRGAVDLLLTDVVMPGGLSGHELGAQLKAQKPRLCVIHMSGFSPEIAGRELGEAQRRYYVQKPASPAVLLHRVRSCLDEENGRQSQ
jgi:two-component system cell cycle sensor histidine kinase/response regulator CckA